MAKILITGSNRGIGLELTRQYLKLGDYVFASCRNPDSADELLELQKSYPEHLLIIQLDVSDSTSIASAAKEIRSHTDRLDILINNAGIAHSGELVGNLDSDTMLNVLHTNSVGPMIVAQQLLDLLKKGNNPKIVNVTSQLGSITRKTSGGRYSYDGSKAALNMFTRTLAFEIINDGIIAIVIHPGWVRTDMGGSSAHLGVEESASGIMDVTDNLTKQDAGRFLQWDGKELPW